MFTPFSFLSLHVTERRLVMYNSIYQGNQISQ